MVGHQNGGTVRINPLDSLGRQGMVGHQNEEQYGEIELEV